MTAQIRDNIDYEGTLIADGCHIPLNKHPRIRYIKKRHRDLIIRSRTACCKGCSGTWRIRRGKLFLTGIDGRFVLIGEEPLSTDWVSGKIRLVSAEIVKYVHMGYFITFEQEIVLQVKNSPVARVMEGFDNNPKEVEHISCR